MQLICCLLLCLAAPSSQRSHARPTPKPGELSLEKAQAVAQAFADRAGFKVRVSSLSYQFIDGEPSSYNGYPTHDGRRWYLGSPSMSFMVGARSGKVFEFRRGDRLDEGRRVTTPGPHAASRTAIVRHSIEFAKKLGVPPPVRVEPMGIFDDSGTPTRIRSRGVVLYGRRRRIQLNFHPKDGDLALFKDSADAPGFAPRDALKTKVPISDRQAVESASKFAKSLGLTGIQFADSFATLQKLMPVRGQANWKIEHPNVSAGVDARTGRVLTLMNRTQTRRFKEGDRPIVITTAAAERHIRKFVSKAGIPASAKANVKITNALVGRIGWVGQFEGTFKWSGKSCYIVCDLRTGELLTMDFLAKQ